MTASPDHAPRPGTDRLLAAFATVFLALQIGLYFPAQIAAGNPDDLTGGHLLPALAATGLAALAGLAAYGLAALLPATGARWTAIVLSALAIAAFVLGSFVTPLTVDAGLIDGDQAALEIGMWLVIADVAAIIALIAVIAALYGRARGVLTNLFPLMTVMALVYSGFLLVASGPASAPADAGDGDEEGDGAGETVFADVSAEADPSLFYRLSPDENVIVVLLDNFDSEFLTVLLEENPALADVFDGFTQFRDVAGVSTNTALAMPPIHAGRYIPPGESIRQAYDRMVREESFLSALVRSGADAELVRPIRNICPEGVRCRSQTFIQPEEGGTGAAEWRTLSEIAAFRVAPHGLKPLLYRGSAWFASTHAAGDDNYVLHAFTERLRADAERPQARFIHLMSPHSPYNRTRDCAITRPDGSMRMMANNMRCALDGVASMLAALREQGLYDGATILLVADHGTRGIGGVEIVRDTRAALGLGEEAVIRHGPQGFEMVSASMLADAPIDDPRPRGSNPLFLFKPPGSEGPLRFDTRGAVSLIDVPATICAHTDLCEASGGVNAYEAPPAARRERVFNQYSVAQWRDYDSSAPISELGEVIVIGHSMVIDVPRPLADAGRETGPAYLFSRPGAFSGFSVNERWGRWSEDVQAGFSLCFDQPPASQIAAVLDGRVWLDGLARAQRVSIALNGRQAHEAAYRAQDTEDGRVQWRLPVSPEDLDPDGCVQVGFDLPDAAPPPQTWRDADRRRLAIGLSVLRIEG